MGYKTVEQVMLRSTQKGAARLVLMVLATFANDTTGRAWPSVPTLAKKCNMCDRQVQMALTKIVESGELRRETGKRDGRVSNTYIFHLPTVNDDSPMGDDATVNDDSPLDSNGESGFTHTVNHDSGNGESGFTVSVNHDSGNGESGFTQTIIEPSIKPSIEPPLEPKREPPQNGRRKYPEDDVGEALQIYQAVTGMLAFPGRDRNTLVDRLSGLVKQYGGIDRAIEVCKPLYQESLTRRTKQGRYYTKLNEWWIDQALAGGNQSAPSEPYASEVYG